MSDERASGGYVARVAGICHLCRHLDRDPQHRGLHCSAFPAGIPPAVRLGAIDHRRPVPGDGGIVFSARRRA